MKKYGIMIAILATTSLFVVAENFVLPKKEKSKKISRKKLQEQCCASSADLLESTTRLIGSASDMQYCSLSLVRDVVDGEAHALLCCAQKEKLAQLDARTKQLREKVSALHKEMQQYAQYVRSL